MIATSFNVFIDIIGRCNLKCPSCSNNHAEFKGTFRPRTIMSPEKLRSILETISAQGHIGFVAPYIWGEPLLHPQFDTMIKIVNDFNIRPSISSNFNVPIDYNKLVELKPAVIHVSLSGFTQNTYLIGHRGGDIRAVKENMRIVAARNMELGNPVRLVALYHLYSYNIQEAPLMKDFAESLGYEFKPYWAAWGSTDEQCNYFQDKGLTVFDETRVGWCRLPYSREDILWALSGFIGSVCGRQEAGYLVMDSEGNVHPCCGTFGHDCALGNILERPVAEFFKDIRNCSICSSCKQQGLHRYDGNVLFTNIAISNLKRNIATVEELMGTSQPLYHCPVCDKEAEDFVPVTPNLDCIAQAKGYAYNYSDFETMNYNHYTCPHCNATDYDRLCALFLRTVFNDLNQSFVHTLVHFTPSKPLMDFIDTYGYISQSCVTGFGASDENAIAISSLEKCKDNSFSFVVCTKTLEHSYNDRKILCELKRILIPGGYGLIHAPILINGCGDETFTPLPVDECWKRFGRNNRVRLYDKQTITKRIKEAGLLLLEVGATHFGYNEYFRHGIASNSILYVVAKG